MDNTQKMAMVGSGLVVAGIGLGVLGAALMAPAVFSWGARLLEHRADGINTKLQGASKTIGSVAGTLHRSFNAARKAGISELRRGA
jgi:hypothetical protein